MRAMGWLLLLGGATLARAQDLDLRGYADERWVAAPEQAAWAHGGLGKSRYGDGESDLRFGGAGVAIAWQVAPQWLVAADLRAQPQYHAGIALLDAFVRYRPVSTDAWRWSLKAGEFFAPVSLENDAIVWTSPWTLSSSAINTWIGEELRTFGTELRIEHRGDPNTFEAAFALFTANDPAGEILAARGWSLGDFVGGVGTHLREPDAYANLIGAAPSRRYDPFVEIDNRLGFYAEATWRSTQFGRATLLYYDNRADPGAYRNFRHGDELFAWRTHFTSLGARSRIGDVEILAQALAGTTEIAPPGFRSETHFAAAYVLAGIDLGAWRPALRVDAFTTREDPAFPPRLSEHGNALTAALNWRPCERLRLTGELLRIDSSRDQRLALGLAPHRIDTQLQFNARVLF